MSELRLDPLTGRWVVISTERAARHHAFRPPSTEIEPELRPCPFCRSDEEPVLTHGEVTVLPNRYSCFGANACNRQGSRPPSMYTAASSTAS